MNYSRWPIWGWAVFGLVIGLIVGVMNNAILESAIICVVVLSLVGVATALVRRLSDSPGAN